MDVDRVLDRARLISKVQFLKVYRKHHNERSPAEPGDTFSCTMYKLHEDASDVRYWQGMLRDVTSYLVLPHHSFRCKDFIQQYGEPFACVVEAYSQHAIGDSCCNDKVRRMKCQHGKAWLECGDIKFIFFSDDSYLAHKGGECSHYHASCDYDEDHLFMGNGLHRLIAYGLLCKEQQRHIPISVYYCQRNEGNSRPAVPADVL